MTKLKTRRPSLTVPRSKLVAPKDQKGRDKWRSDHQAHRKWYSSAKWQRLSEEVKADADFHCGMCGAYCAGKYDAICDHKEPHRGDEKLFWDRSNLWCICKKCHDGDKKRLEIQQYGLY